MEISPEHMTHLWGDTRTLNVVQRLPDLFQICDFPSIWEQSAFSC
jgi:hypothetical protein